MPLPARTKYSLAVLVASVFLCAASGDAHAQQGGLTVSPAMIDVSVGAQKPEVMSHLTIRNDFSAPVELSLSLAGLEQQGTQLVPTGKTTPELNDIISFEPRTVTVLPGKSSMVTVYFRDSKSIRPGGHYGSIIIQQMGVNSKHIGLQAAVSVGLFITKLDGVSPAVYIQDIRTNATFFRLPTVVDISFKNSGNVLVVPRASIVTKNGRAVVSTGIVNSESIGVLPGETVVIRAILSRAGGVELPGVYRTDVLYRIDGLPEQKITAVSHVYMPLSWVGGVTAVMIIIYLLHRRKKYSHKPILHRRLGR